MSLLSCPPQKERFNTMLLKAIEEKFYQQKMPPAFLFNYLRETGDLKVAQTLIKTLQKHQPVLDPTTTAACQTTLQAIKERLTPQK